MQFTTLHKRFQEQAKATPDQVALIGPDGTIVSYQELLQQAHQLAKALRVMGVQRNEPVAILMDRSIEMMIALFGVLFSGGAYLPIHPTTPRPRIQKILQIADAKLVLISEAQRSFSFEEGEVLVVGEVLSKVTSVPELEEVNQPEDLAYIIFTSGSTGEPKGVMVPHQAVMNRLEWMAAAYQLDDTDVLLQKTPFIFDVSVWELFLWFFRGAKMALLEPGHEKFPQAIVQAVAEHTVTFIHFIPSLLNVFLNYIGDEEVSKIKHLKYVFCSGETLHTHQVEAFYQNFETTQLVNFYGPTEATVDVTYFDVPRGHEGQIPIGTSIDNVQIHILDDDQNPVVNEEGEIAISGIGLAKGYVNRESLTHEHFIQHEGLERRIYKTGDRGVITQTGIVYFYGRKDHQVKIRGIRIEIGEIENSLIESDLLEECVICLEKKSDSIVLIVAYIAFKNQASVAELKKFAKENLPDFMVPNRYETVKEFPRLTSGKIDRKSLHRPKEASLI